MSAPCLDCGNKVKEQNLELENLRLQAKKDAIRDQKSKAICKDEVTGLFITDAETAVREHFFFLEFVSYVS